MSATVSAITSGMREGLTMVVGPPGTGKTDVAVQIISNLYLHLTLFHTFRLGIQHRNFLFLYVVAHRLTRRATTTSRTSGFWW